MAQAKTHTVDTSDAKYNQGVQLYGQRRFQEAFVLFEAALAETQNPGPELWNDWAVAALACDQLARAEEGFRRSLLLNPENIQAAANLGVLLANLNRTAEAVPVLEKVVANVAGEQRVILTQLLAACRTKVMADALRQSQQAFRDLATRLQPADSANQLLSRAGKQPEHEFWYPRITGWFTSAEALHLSTIIKLARPRRILEIGTFFGRSTASICSAIRAMKILPEFVTIDLDIRSEQEFRKAFCEIHGIGEISVPAEYAEAFQRGMSSSEYARYNLEQYHLADFVNIQSGDFRQLGGKFDLVFADVMHEKTEIQRNLAPVLALIGEDGILAVHDFSEENKALIESSSNDVEFISRCETLGIYRVRPIR